MAIEPVKVPANVQVEEKIVGPVGLRQLFLLLGGGGVSYLFFTILQEVGYRGSLMLVAWLPLGVTAAFAFITVNDISLLKLIFLQIEKMDKPAIRTFGPRRGIEVNIRTAINDTKETPTKADRPADADLEALSSRLDIGPQEEDVTGTGIVAITASDDEGPSIDDLFAPGLTDDDEDEEEKTDEDPPFFRDLIPPTHS